LTLCLAQREVEIREAGATQHAFGGYTTVFLAQPAQDFDGFVAGRRERRMAPFGGEHGERAGICDHAAHTEAGADAEDGARALDHRKAKPLRADGSEVGAAQRAYRVPDGLEIVDDLQVVEALRLAQRTRRKIPGAVRELNTVLFDPPRDRDRRTAQALGYAGCIGAVVLGRVGDGLVRTHRVATHTVHIHGCPVGPSDRDPEADVCSADVRHQAEHGGGIKEVAF
jgi:hypothetical protein